MTYILLPKSSRTPYMRVDCDDYYRRGWTRQPGGEGILHVEVVGRSDAEPVKTNAAADAMPRLFETRRSPQHDDSSVIQLRDYQEECVQAVHDAWARGVRAPLVVLPTGAGKTIIAASLMSRAFGSRAMRSVFVAHRRELLQQTVEKIDLVTMTELSPRIGIVQGKRNELGADITVASIKSLGPKRLGKFIDAGPYQILICDEAHHAVSAEWIRMVNAMREAFPDLLMFGMTATPGRADGTALDRVFDEVVYEKNLLDMIQMGYLVPPKGFAVNLGLNLDRVKSSGGDFVQKQLSRLMNQPRANQAVVEAWRQYSHNRKTVVFGVDVSHAKMMKQEFIDAGYKAEHVDGKMGVRERKAVFKRFREGETKILVNCEIAIEGFDEPSIECVLFARPTQSQAMYIQSLGRGLRLYPGKTECIVIDCVGNAERHRPVQLASLAGFDPERRGTGRGGDGEGAPNLPSPEDVPTVLSTNPQGREFDLTSKQAKTRYQWRETKLGWVLQIPRIGYYLVAWSSKSHTKCVVRFYDQRPGRKQSLPTELVRQPIDFQLAYELVESEMDRFFRARSGRSMVRRRDGSVYEDPKAEDREFETKAREELPEINFVDLDDGVSEQLEVPEAMMMRDASWRSKPVSEKQVELLIKLGVKQRTMPTTAGEASDLITILRIEKDAKRRLPATHKQIAYLKVNELPVPQGLTKGRAAQMIWKHRKATGR